jgi:hypothetical protein
MSTKKKVIEMVQEIIDQMKEIIDQEAWIE